MKVEVWESDIVWNERKENEINVNLKSFKKKRRVQF